ncbi:MAG: CHAT domain-containing protein [Cyanobacteria bacterium J06626_14]
MMRILRFRRLSHIRFLQIQSLGRYGAIALLTAVLCVAANAWHPAVAISGHETAASSSSSSEFLAQQVEPTAQQLYADGRYEQAVIQLTASLEELENDPVGQAVVLSNLSLTYQQLGQWSAANEAIQQALSILQEYAVRDAPDWSGVFAQALDVQGSYYLAVGEGESAVSVWQQSAQVFDDVGLQTRAVTSRVNQAQALQSLGFYQQAIALLQTLKESLEDAPDSIEKAAALRSLGEAQRVAGSVGDAKASLEASLTIVQTLNDSEAIAQTFLSRGNASRAEIDLFTTSFLRTDQLNQTNQQLIAAAASDYRAAVAQSNVPITQVQALLNLLSLWIEVENWDEAIRLYPSIEAQLAAVPPGRPAVYAQVNYAQSLMDLKTAQPQRSPEWAAIAQLLTDAYQQAVELDDARAQSFALGHLGELYENNQQWQESQEITRRALALSQSINAQDIAYRWQWQSGRVLRASGNYDAALDAYSEAFKTLQVLRSDLVAANADVKFSFRKSVEPIYREYVDLLLRPSEAASDPSLEYEGPLSERPILPTNQDNLRRARDVMEALQVAQLENFFQSACLEPTLQIDAVIQARNQRAAVIYPIILSDRLEVIIKLPEREDLIHYAPVYAQQADVERYLQEFRRVLQGVYTYRQIEEKGKVIYDWLIGQANEQLMQSQIETLIFVLDGSLRNVPMAALYDGEQYLVQSYAVDLVLGLEVSGIQSLDRSRMRVLAAGLVNPPPDFRNTYAQLENVKAELDMIEASDIRSVLLREEEFQRDEFNDEFNQRTFQVVHLATHGQFGADRDNTFILDAQGKVELDDMSELFGAERQVSDEPIQLLVMSACRTATGDDREVLGIAGTTVRAGARSALASLWSLDDEASVTFMREFYQNLGKPGISRAEAIRIAQETMLNNPNFNHPRFWSAYVLVGSWL